jgi:RNA polymerase sigma factor (TIGR02999 family)
LQGEIVAQSDAEPEELAGQSLEDLLHRASAGDRAALNSAFGEVYGELRRLARTQRSRWSGDETLNTTALVHEVYLKLSTKGGIRVTDRAHFYALASRAMRHILVNYAERRQARKRAGGAIPEPLDLENPVSSEQAMEILAVHRALDRLVTVADRPVRVVECRFFAGLTVPETAEALGISAATVKRDWTLASTWLRQELADAPEGEHGAS